ncbi:Eaa protein [Escherichia coli]|nr:Eaa protein [Escherichia coli]
MSTITKEFTKEQLQQIIETDHVQCGEASALARIALASLEAEPYGYVHKAAYEQAGSCGLSGDHEAYRDSSTHIAVYTATPAPVSVPAAMEIDDDFDSAFEHGKAVGWNAYRAAMLQSGNFRENKNSSTNNFREIAETSTNYPVIPSEVLSAIREVAKIRADFDDFDGDRRGIGDCLDEAEQELIVTINKYASQLAAEPIAPNDVREQTAIPQVPVTPDGWVMVPKEPTQAMIKAWLSEIANFRGHAAGYRAALEAAPQLEVNRG